MRTIRIFISSPGDVEEEREKARQVIASLQRDYGDQVRLVAVLWEDLAIPATASFQEGIDFVLAERHRIDIAVFILWSRLGSPPLSHAVTKKDGSPYRSGTEREFDLMLTAFEQSGGKTPVILAYTRRDDEGFNERLDAREHGDDALEELVRQRKLVKQFIRENFQDEEGHNLRAYYTYREPVSFAQRLHVHLRGAVDDLLGLDRPAAMWSEAPYRSLEVFDIRHAPIFCGRDGETCDLLDRLRDQESSGCSFVCIVGASGSGKSSLARAGVAATLVRGSFDGNVKEWRTSVFLPSLAGGNLPQALARALADALPELREGVGGLERFAKRLGDIGEAATDLLEAAFQAASVKLGGAVRLLLILDQMEEFWTDHSITPDQREKFLQSVEVLARGGRLYVLATLRSDFYPQAQLSEAFLRMKGERGHFDLTPPGTAALRELILQPACRAGLHFQRGERSGHTLDQTILEDASRDPSALPLLQFALAVLYERRDEKQNRLTFAAYEDMGGVEGALGQRATQTFELLPEEAKAAFDELLPLLISVDIADERKAVCRRAPLENLTNTPARRDLVEALVRARFITTDKQSGIPIAAFAHEALLRRWDRLTEWINRNRDLLRMRTRIEHYQFMWEETGRDASGLLPPGLPLEEGRKLVGAVHQVLDEKTRMFVLLSAQHHDQQRLRTTRRRKLAFAVLSGLTLLAVTASFLAWEQKKVAVKERKAASDESEHRKQQLLEAARSDRLDALEAFKQDNRYRALAHLSRSMSYDPTSTLAAEIAVSRLNTWGGLLPLSFFQGHHGWVKDAHFSHNGKWIVTASEDETAKVWEAATGRLVATLKGHQSAVSSAEFSPDDQHIVTSSELDQTARLWEAATGKLLATFPDHEDSYTWGKKAIFSPDGKCILTKSSAKNAAVWDAVTGERITVLQGHTDELRWINFNPDGQRILTASNDNTARIWETSTGKLITTLSGHTRQVNCAEYSGDGKRIATASNDGTSKVWEAATGKLLATLAGHTTGVTSVHFSRDGRRIVTTAFDGTARVWETTSGRERLVLQPQSHFMVLAAAFSPDGRLIATRSKFGPIRVWDATSGTLLGADSGEELYHSHIEGEDDPQDPGIEFSSDGQRILAASGATATVWEACSRQLKNPLRGHTDTVLSAHFSADGRRVVTASGDKTVRIWDVASGAPLMVLKGLEWAKVRAEFSPDGLLILAISSLNESRYADSNAGGEVAHVFNAQTGRLIFSVPSHTEPREQLVTDYHFSLDGKRLVTASLDRTARIWDSVTGKLLTTLNGHESVVTSAVFSPNGRKVVTASLDGSSRVWDSVSGKLLAILKRPRQEHNDLVEDAKFAVFSPNGNRVATASSDNTAHVWDASSGQRLATMHVPTDGSENDVAFGNLRIRSVQFSPDGQLLATGSADQTARIWEASTGKLLVTLAESSDAVTSVQFVQDGSRVITFASNKEAQIWDVATGQLLVPAIGPGTLAGSISPDGQHIMVDSNYGVTNLWELLGTGDAPPPWFADFLTLMAQWEFRTNGELHHLTPDEFLSLKARLTSIVTSEHSRYADIARRFLTAEAVRDNSPRKFSFNYTFDDPVKRIWIREGDVWTETHPSGMKVIFHLIGRTTINEVAGTEFERADGLRLRVFIPDRSNVAAPQLLMKKDDDWVLLGTMEDIE